MTTTPSADQVAATSSRSSRHTTRAVWLRNAKVITGLSILVVFTILAIIGGRLAPYDPSELGPDMLAAPSSKHWLGTTNTGQDILSQLLVGTRGVMIVGFSSGIMATLIAMIVGVSAGYLGGVRDDILSSLSNIFLVIPQLPLIIIIAGQLPKSSQFTVAFVISITGWAWGARVLRSQTLSLRQRDFVEAARAAGESTPRIIFFEIMPNLSAIIASTFINTVIAAVLSEITLAFIGIASISNWNWGTILFWAQSNQALYQGAWWWFVPAGLCIALLGMALALVNFGIDEFVNPRLRNTGMSARQMRRRHIQPRVGFTPIDRSCVAQVGQRRPNTASIEEESNA